ncbi:tRNA lysidine(34) synthetase TilS [Salinicoccus sp. ID82-1]|uniref:tRNA lysidine(34) synthetase TilS n=1 Tax=Salinicoccus sp. ID82-1 TaxID=2820269 RepID=UPI001F00BFD8|nr:tRNA lysidine(34) synthetase TilS [Salinicoccus sp. ID82-1]MCG1009502.1 tRNA lysidine(34) synthetase TilS [Salinicoccus sp. ID82-1]
MELFTPWGREEKIALAISGGMDSMVLYNLLNTVYRESYGSLILLHVNHGQRAASVDEAAYIMEMAQQDGRVCEMVVLDIPPGTFSQESAREARYHFFDEMMARHGASMLLTAHHLDDQYETILHAVLTGRHLPGEMGIPAERHMPGYTIVRPMIDIGRAEIAGYARAHDVHYFEDETNSGTDYTRNYIRHRLMPPIRESAHLQAHQLLRVKQDMSDVDDILKARAAAFLAHHEKNIDRHAFNREKRIVRFYILKAWLAQHGDAPRRRHIDAIMDAIWSDISNASFEMDHTRIIISYDRIVKKQGQDEKMEMLQMGGDGIYRFNGYTITSRLDAECYPMTVRTRAEGDRMYIPGVGTKKLSRIFIDNKIPADERGTMPVVVDKNRQIIALGEIYNIMDSKEKNRRLIIEKEFTNGPEK